MNKPDIEYIRAFLATVEGEQATRGYIPCFLKGGGSANFTGSGDPGRYIAMGQSGITIATGCDLGQTDRATLTAYGLDPAITALLSPCFGLRKDKAIAWLARYPLSITRAQAQALDDAVHDGYLRRYVIPAWEKASGKSFADQPRQAQAVIMSLCFQKGCAGVRRDWPITWKHLVACNWKAAARELVTGFRQYAGRRRKEGKLLEEI